MGTWTRLGLVFGFLMISTVSRGDDKAEAPLPKFASMKLGNTNYFHGGPIGTVAYSPDGTIVASAGGYMTTERSACSHVLLMDAVTGKHLRKLEGHDKYVSRVMFAPDGKTLASVGDDHQLILWDVATGKERNRLGGLWGRTYTIAFSADGSLIASDAGGKIIVWSTGGKELQQIQLQPGDYPLYLAFNANNDLVYGCNFARAKPANQQPGGGGNDNNQDDIKEPGAKPAPAKEPDPARNINKKLILPKDFPNVPRQPGNNKPMPAPAPVPAAPRLADLFESGARIDVFAKDKDEFKLKKTIDLGHISGMTVKDNQAVLVGVEAGHTQGFPNLFDMKHYLLNADLTKGEVKRLHRVDFTPTTTRFAPDAKSVATVEYVPQKPGKVHIVDVESGKSAHQLKVDSTYVTSFAFSKDCKNLALGSNDFVATFDVATGKETSTRPSGRANITGLAFSRDGDALVAIDSDRAMSRWGLRERKVEGQWQPDLAKPQYETYDTSVTIAKNGEIAAVFFGQNQINVLDLVNKKVLRELTKVGLPMTLSADGATLICHRLGAQKGVEEIQAIDVESGKELASFSRDCDPKHKQGYGFNARAKVSPDGKRIAIVSEDGGNGQFVSTLACYELKSGKKAHEFEIKGFFAKYDMIAWSPDGASLVASVGGGQGVVLLDATTGKVTQRFAYGEIDKYKTCRLVFSPNGKLLAGTAIQDNAIVVWDLEAGKQIGTLKGHEGNVHSLAFSEDGKRLASGGTGTILIWDIIAMRR